MNSLRRLALLAAALLSFMVPAGLAQAADTATIDIQVLDCRGIESSDLADCVPGVGVPFAVQSLSIPGVEIQFPRTDESGHALVTHDATECWKVTYSSEIAWTDDLPFLITDFRIFCSGSDHAIAQFVLLDQSANTPGVAELTVRTWDCTDENSLNPESCVPIPGLPFVVGYEGLNGTTSADDGTDSSGQRVLSGVAVPALLWISFYVEQLDFDLVPVDSEMQVLLLPGESKTLNFIFVGDADGPVTQLPDTGAGECAIRSCDP